MTEESFLFLSLMDSFPGTIVVLGETQCQQRKKNGSVNLNRFHSPRSMLPGTLALRRPVRTCTSNCGGRAGGGSTDTFTMTREHSNTKLGSTAEGEGGGSQSPIS